MDNTGVMEAVASEENGETIGGMGNESSTLDVTKEPLSLNSTQGQFHKVLVEPDYSILDLPANKDPEVSSSSLNNDTEVKENGPTVDQNFEKEADEQITKEDTHNDETKKPVVTSYTDDEIIETSRKLVEESIAEALKTVQSEAEADKQASPDVEIGSDVNVNDLVDDVQSEVKANVESELKSKDAPAELEQENDKDTVCEKIVTDIDEGNKKEEEGKADVEINEKVSSKKDKKSKKLKAKEQYLREREVIDSVKQFMKEEEKKSKDKKEFKKGLSFPSMFKFRRRKQKSEVEPETTVDAKQADENTSNDIAVAEVGADATNIKVEMEKQDGAPENHVATGRQPGVKRLNSLDSGIDVDKLSDNANGVEYSVVNKTKINTAASNGNKVNSVANGTTDNDKDLKTTNDPVYMNGEKTGDDAVYVNERAIDVTDKDIDSQNLKAETVEDNVESNKESAEAKDTVPKVKKVDQIRRTEKFKLKKKSWSFNIGGSKKTENTTEGIVSMDPSVSNKESGKEQVAIKKSKWRLGKFSFRKAEDLFASTPDLNNESNMTKSKSSLDSEISESPEHVEKKKGTKLKKIKAKKEKKKNKDVADAEDMTVRSASLSNIALADEKPRSRRSIVEDEVDFTQTDAFEGVAVSDLSQDEDDTEVSMNPAGSKKEKTTAAENGVKDIQQDKTNDIKVDKIKATKEEQTNAGVIEGIKENANDIQQDKTIDITEDTIKDIADVKADEPGKDTDSTGGVYVNVTKGVTGSLEAEPKIVDKSPQKYIVAGDDEYAQIIKTDNKDVNIPVIENTEQLPLLADIVVGTDLEKVPDTTIQDDIDETFPDPPPPEVLEEQITSVQGSGLECKARPDSFDKLVSNNDDNVQESGTADNVVNTEAPVENDNNDQSNTLAYSNLIYSDESFTSELEQGKALHKITDEKIHQDNESDAYVQLEELVKDFNGEHVKEKPSNLVLPSTENKDITGINELSNKVAEPSINGCITDNTNELNDNDAPVSPTIISRASITLSVAPKVIIMKEAGVQAPDIHMPLDRELDFGFIKGKPHLVSVGIQVTDASSDQDQSDLGQSSSVGTAVAYF